MWKKNKIIENLEKERHALDLKVACLREEVSSRHKEPTYTYIRKYAGYSGLHSDCRRQELTGRDLATRLEKESKKTSDLSAQVFTFKDKVEELEKLLSEAEDLINGNAQELAVALISNGSSPVLVPDMVKYAQAIFDFSIENQKIEPPQDNSNNTEVPPSKS